jgi:hypothetical protein
VAFFHVGEQVKTNDCVVKYVSSFLSNITEPSKITQQWGVKPSEEELVKVEIISYNKG